MEKSACPSAIPMSFTAALYPSAVNGFSSIAFISMCRAAALVGLKLRHGAQFDTSVFSVRGPEPVAEATIWRVGATQALRGPSKGW